PGLGVGGRRPGPPAPAGCRQRPAPRNPHTLGLPSAVSAPEPLQPWVAVSGQRPGTPTTLGCRQRSAPRNPPRVAVAAGYALAARPSPPPGWTPPRPPPPRPPPPARASRTPP